MPVWPGKKPRLMPIFGGATVSGQESFGTFLFVTVTVGAPVAVITLGVWNMPASVEADGGVGEPLPASGGGVIGTGSLLLAAESCVGAKVGSPVGGFVADGISSRCPALRVASSASPLTAAIPA